MRCLQASDPAASLLACFPVQLLAAAMLFQHFSPFFFLESLFSFHSAAESTRERRAYLLDPFRADTFPHCYTRCQQRVRPTASGGKEERVWLRGSPSFLDGSLSTCPTNTVTAFTVLLVENSAKRGSRYLNVY